jgi:hypothetical protein
LVNSHNRRHRLRWHRLWWDLSGKRETLNWTRDQRLKAYVELLTAIDKCYAAFNELAKIMKELGYPIDVRDNPKSETQLTTGTNDMMR